VAATVLTAGRIGTLANKSGANIEVGIGADLFGAVVRVRFEGAEGIRLTAHAARRLADALITAAATCEGEEVLS
jgi:hypothetical protein